MKMITFRLKPGNDLKESIEKVVNEQAIKAGFIVTCVAGLQQACVRMAGAKPDSQDIRTFTGDFEVVSLVGTVSVNGVHLHMSFSDTEGVVRGGHLKEGTIIHPTAEIVIGVDEGVVFTRELDADTGFSELKVGRL
ncbi:MAG TPA: PPC domain-containing DNA-binding protein [Candidatus Saccharimonadales bacterium]|jgi:predicted DNA-binding protein with PD1-like motif|nr:PPC domain-containing DNA-binding protein [Candidatus Saccharimonadales bacterium]